jgi:hypothetical protein
MCKDCVGEGICAANVYLDVSAPDPIKELIGVLAQ